MTHFDERLESPRAALKLSFGLVPLLAGLDKFFNLLTDWPQYIAGPVAAVLPVSAEIFMYGVGLVEIAVGVAVLSRWTELGSKIAGLWLLAIAANLAVAGFFDIAVRDVVLAVAAFTLTRLTQVQEEAPAPVEVREAHREPPRGAQQVA